MDKEVTGFFSLTKSITLIKFVVSKHVTLLEQSIIKINSTYEDKQHIKYTHLLNEMV